MQVMEEPMKRGVLSDLVLTNKEGLIEDVKFGAALAAVTMKWWRSGSCVEEAGQQAGSKPWNSEEITLASSRSYLEESTGSGH